MTEIPYQELLSVFLFLLFPLVGGFVAVRLRMSPVIGYIVGGVFLKLVAGNRLPHEFIDSFSTIGLILLIFTIGLETNFNSLRRFGRFVLLGGLLQIVVTAGVVSVLSLLFGFTSLVALFIGSAFAMSSTAVVAKIIQERGEENSLVGGLAIGILIFQDLAFIPLLIVLSSFGSNSTFLDMGTRIVLNMGKAILVLALVYFLGMKAVPFLFNRLANVSREILNLFTVVFIVATLTVFSFLGLSSLLAAFTAGVLIGQTLVHYHLFSQIRPLRDVLVVVFFVFLGLTLNIGFTIANIIPITLFAVLVTFAKIVIVMSIFLFFKFHSRTSFKLGILLFQIGEGAFILLYQGFINGAVGADSYHFAVSVVLLTLLFTPAAIMASDRMYSSIRSLIRKRIPAIEQFLKNKVDREIPKIDVLNLKDHIIICGYGRVGRYIGRALMFAEIPFIAIDFNLHTVEQAKKEGVTIFYGDPTEIDVLDYAECETAASLIAAVPDRFSQETIILNAKKLNPNIILFTRVHGEHDQRRMKDLGVEVVVHPEFEASLSIIRRILTWKGIDKEEVANKIKRLKIEHGMV